MAYFSPKNTKKSGVFAKSTPHPPSDGPGKSVFQIDEGLHIINRNVSQVSPPYPRDFGGIADLQKSVFRQTHA